MRLPRPARYLVVATLGAVIQGIVVTLAMCTGSPPVLATVVGIEAAILHNFAWHDRWTWRDRPRGESRVLRLARYNAAMAGGSLVVGGLVSWTVIQGLGGGILVANVAAVAAAACANYAASDRLIFTRASSGGCRQRHGPR
jgi:putative flippase GtrA